MASSSSFFPLVSQGSGRYKTAMMQRKDGVLALEDGSIFRGSAFGHSATVTGEAVFNTSMSGYQEILTDPSYYGQLVTMTAPQIGNYGVNPEDEESDGPKAMGFIVRDLSPMVSNWRSRESLPEYLKRHRVPGLTGVDTRTITKKLRVQGAMKACLSTEDISDAEAVEKARAWPGLVGVDYVREVTCRESYAWDTDCPGNQPYLPPGTFLRAYPNQPARFKLAAYDFGAKYSIFRKLSRHGFAVQVFPADTPAKVIHEFGPDAVFLSNGPGDPAALTYAHQAVRDLIGKYPVYGICLGHQIITHAIGASTFKLKFGHRGGNQPVKNLETGKISITAQNHGFASLPEDLEKHGAVVTEINLNDQTVAGLRLREHPVMSVQYHPEAGPGPNDAESFFFDFYETLLRLHGTQTGGNRS